MNIHHIHVMCSVGRSHLLLLSSQSPRRHTIASVQLFPRLTITQLTK